MTAGDDPMNCRGCVTGFVRSSELEGDVSAMANADKRLDLDSRFVDMFRKYPAVFWKRCTENRTGLFLAPYQERVRKGGFRLFGKKTRKYTAADFPAIRRKGPGGEDLTVVFLPRPEEEDLLFYHMAYGVSCINWDGIPLEIQLHIVQYNKPGQPSIIRVDGDEQTIVLGTTEDTRDQADMLWRAAFGNRVDPVSDTEMFFDGSGQPEVRVRKNPFCGKMAEYEEDDGWADPEIAQRASGGSVSFNAERKGTSIYFNVDDLQVYEETDLSEYAATENIFGPGLSPEEERRRREELAAWHKCSPDAIRLDTTIHGGTYAVCTGSGKHFLYEEYDDNHRLVWMESISTQ